MSRLSPTAYKPATTASSTGVAQPQHTIWLLLATGTLIGFNFPLGKLAGDAGISPLIWALAISVGVIAMLFPILLGKRQLAMPKGALLRYAVISAVISYVIPNLLLFSVIPHIGSGYSGIMFALSPLFTLLMAMLFGVKRPSSIGMLGIATGLLGVVIVSVTRGNSPDAPPLLWLLAGICIPLVLASGNIYRTLRWPEQALPDVLAFWSHLFSVMILLMLIGITRGGFPLQELLRAPLALVLQILVAGVAFRVFFRLQQQGGPVLLSQIGYVAAAVGLLAATLVLGEHYSHATWLGAAIIACGIGITIVAQMTE